MNRRFFRHAFATGVPAALILAAALGAGPLWAWLALLSVSALVLGLDGFWPEPAEPADTAPGPGLRDGLPIALALVHFAILAASVGAISGALGQTGPEPGLSAFDKLALFLAAGFFMGQVSNSNAHELIHRSGRWMRRLGAAVYVSLLFGHHASAHPAVHHRYVGTPRDPNTARLGEGFYRFAIRAWRGSFRAGLEVETERLARRGRTPWHPANPYWGYVGGALLALGLTYLLAGWAGLAVYLLLATHSTMQLLLSDYVQHYGLVRAARPGGGYEPVGPRHSWNAPHWYSALLMLNAPRHSDHHANPARDFTRLRLDAPDNIPHLPHSLPVMGAVALWPPAWRRAMNRRARAWQADPQ